MRMRGVILLGIFWWFVLPEPAFADHAVYLVARADCPVDSMDALDIRKIYLGFSVRTDANEALRAATNLSDEELYEIFLQDMMAMSERSYDRRLLTLTLQSGRRRPDIYTNSEELLRALEQDPTLITFMWKEDYEAAENLKVLRVIWGH